MEQDRAGDYKPKQERRAEQLTFGELMEKHYLPWAKENKGHSSGDFSRYGLWLKPMVLADMGVARLCPETFISGIIDKAMVEIEEAYRAIMEEGGGWSSGVRKSNRDERKKALLE